MLGLNRSYSTNSTNLKTKMVVSNYYFIIFILILNRYKSILLHLELLPITVQFTGHVSLSVSRDQCTAISLVGVLVT